MPQHIGHAMLSDINISHGSVPALLSCGGICNDLYCKFPAECNSERILKIGHYLVNKSLVSCFYWTTVCMQIFAEVPWERGVKRQFGVVENSNCQRFAGYFFRNFRDEACVIM